MKPILALVCLLAFPADAETARDRCIAARDAAAKLLASDAPTEEQTARWRTAEKHAFAVCTSSEVPAELRIEAIVRWSGTLNDVPAELSLLKKTLREAETSEGPDSPALLPLIDRLAGLYSIHPSERREAVDLAHRGLRIRKAAFGETSSATSLGLALLGIVWFVEEMPDRNLPLAEKYFREAVTVAEQACGPNCEALRGALGLLHSAIKEQPGRDIEAEEIEKRLDRLVYEAVSRQ